jgi:uncharacterized LabA/DUF88 family protein
VDNVLWWHPPRNVTSLSDLLRAIRERFGDAVDVRLVATEVSTSDAAALRDAALRASAHLTLLPRRRGSSVDVELALQVMQSVRNGVERLVLASLDRDLTAVIDAVKRAGVHTVVLSPPEHIPVTVGLAAD